MEKDDSSKTCSQKFNQLCAGKQALKTSWDENACTFTLPCSCPSPSPTTRGPLFSPSAFKRELKCLGSLESCHKSKDGGLLLRTGQACSRGVGLLG